MPLTPKVIANLLQIRQRHLDAPVTSALADETPREALERLMYRRPLLPPAVMRSGSVPEQGQEAWIQGALGEFRLASRTDTHLVYEVCKPLLPGRLLEKARRDEEMLSLDLRVVCQLLLRLELVKDGTFCITGSDAEGKLILYKEGYDLALTLNQGLEHYLALKPGVKVKVARGPSRLRELGNLWEYPVGFGFLGFLVQCYGALMHGLYDDRLMMMGAWLLGGLAVGFLFRLCGAIAR